MTTKRAIVVDDEIAARRKLKKMLDSFERIEVIGEAEDGEAALQLINRLQPDIAFLDIEMPEMNGMELAQSTATLGVQVVFVTAYEQFAVQAFETQAVDYLLKPVSAERLAGCVDTLMLGRRGASTAIPDHTHVKSSQPLSIRHGAAVRLVNPEHIAWLESVEGYCRIWLDRSGRAIHKQASLITDSSLTQAQNQLDEENFLRISRSAVINISQVVRHWTKKRQMFIVLRDFEERPIAVSRRNAASIRRRWP